MDRKFLPMILSMILLMGFGTVAYADLTPEQIKQAKALIAQFSNRQFAVRQQAVDKLVKLGPDVISLVQKTLEETKDAEVKLRCGMVIKGIDEKHGISASAKVIAARKFGYYASRITIRETDAPLAEIVSEFARQSGNRPIVIHRQLRGRTASLNVKDMPYWQAIDALCKAAKASYVTNYSSRPPVLSKSLGGQEPSAYAGPVEVSVTRVQRALAKTRTFRVQKGDQTSRSLTVSMRFRIEDRLPLIGSKATFTKVTGPGGKVLKATPVGGNYYRWGSKFHTASGTVTLRGEDADVAGPLAVEGTVELEFGVGAKELRIDNILAGGEQFASAKDTHITLLEAQREDTTLRVKLRVKSAAALHPRLISSTIPDYGFSLVAPGGTRHARITRRGIKGSLKKGTEASLELTFSTIPQVDGNWSLAFRYPAKVEWRTHAFKLTNVPLP